MQAFLNRIFTVDLLTYRSATNIDTFVTTYDRGCFRLRFFTALLHNMSILYEREKLN